MAGALTVPNLAPLRRSMLAAVCAAALLLESCIGGIGTTVTPGPAQPTASAPHTPTPDPLREVVIVHTSDEHGHLLPYVVGRTLRGGVAYIDALWRDRGESSRAAGGTTLLLSGGDNFVGPAISTWFEGESSIEAMNALGYDASAVGNHEFDLGQEVLRQRAAQAAFPYLAANLLVRGTQQVVPWAQPYLVTEVNGVSIGIIGLAMQQTPAVVAARNLEGLAFADYEPTLRRWVPAVRELGAQILVVESHACLSDLVPLAGRVADLDIALFLGGHCHESLSTAASGTLIAAARAFWEGYAVARFIYDLGAGRIVERTVQTVDVATPSDARVPFDPQIESLVAKWQARERAALGEVIGYTATGLPTQSPALHNLLVDSWLWAYPQAQVAVSNVGGFRQGFERGEITLGDIVGTFPFDNDLLEIEVTGRDVSRLVNEWSADLVFGGLRRLGDGRLMLADGGPISATARYRLLVLDYLYDNAKYPFQAMDASPYETGIPWRQPVIDWLRLQRTTRLNPLESALSAEPRP